MRYLVAILAVLLLALPALADDVVDDTFTFNGGYGGLFAFQEDGTWSTSSFDLGATYQPEVITSEFGKAIVTSSPWIFWDNHCVRDGAPDLNMVGLGYRIYSWGSAGLAFYIEGAAIMKGIAEDRVKIGEYGGLRVPFKAMTKNMRFHLGGGWDGDSAILVVRLNFAG